MHLLNAYVYKQHENTMYFYVALKVDAVSTAHQTCHSGPCAGRGSARSGMNDSNRVK